MKNQYKQETWMGVLCGVVFAAVAWGYDGFLLAHANAALPWLKLAFGLPICAAVGGLAGWLTMKINNMFTRMALWIAVAILFSYLTSLIPFSISPVFLRWSFPELSERILYNAPAAINARRFITIVMTIIFLFIAGLIFENVNDSIRNSRGIVGMLFSAIFLLLFFGGAGYTADSNFNADLRAPLIALDEKLDYVATVNQATLSETEQRAIKRFTKLDVNFQGPHRLVITTFDEFISQITVAVDFDGTFAECSVMNGRVSSCKMVE
jgi:hypothetical protein